MLLADAGADAGAGAGAGTGGGLISLPPRALGQGVTGGIINGDRGKG